MNLSRTMCFLLGCLSCGATAGAQVVTASIVAQTNLEVHATGGPSQVVLAGTNLAAGANLLAQGANSQGNAQVTTRIAPLMVSPYGVTADFRCFSEATATVWLGSVGAWCGSAGGSRRVNDVLLVLQASQPVGGAVEISYQLAGYLLDPSVSASGLGMVDVGDDGSFEFQSPTYFPGNRSVRVPVRFGPGTLAVRMVAWTYVYLRIEFPYARATSDLTVRFVPDAGCSVQPHAPACGSLVTVARENFTFGIDLDVHGLQPPGRSLAALAIGLQPANLPLPLPPNCTLATQPIGFRWLPQDPGGNATTTLDIPLFLRPMSGYVQVLELDFVAGTLQAGEALRIDCL